MTTARFQDTEYFNRVTTIEQNTGRPQIMETRYDSQDYL